MSVPAWLEGFVLAVGEDELRRTLVVAVDAGDFCAPGTTRAALLSILKKPRAKGGRTRQSR